MNDIELFGRAPHGHVTPRADGTTARCGGPAICGVCYDEQREALRARVSDGLTPGQAETIARTTCEKCDE